MKAAQLTNNIVTNVIEVDSLDVIPGLIDGTNAAIGDTWDGMQFIKPATPGPTIEDYDRALVECLDAEARTRRYDNRINCTLRAGYVGPYQVEGIAFAQWMDQCNQIGYSMLEQFTAGQIPQPTVAEFIAALPTMVWP